MLGSEVLRTGELWRFNNSLKDWQNRDTMKGGEVSLIWTLQKNYCKFSMTVNFYRLYFIKYPQI
jgi:hypothetical protein